MTQYERGSEWRRWELHMHTPETQKNDQFNGATTEEKWNNFYNDISSYIGEGNDALTNIEVFAVTDYLSIENYKKIIDDDRLPKSIKLVLPNVEMRIVPLSKKSPVNIHCIFNPQIVDELEDRFFSKLSFTYQDRSFTALRSSLISLGKLCSGDKNLDSKIAYSKGIEQFVITIESIKNVFKNDSELRDNVIIAISNSDCDGASGITKNNGYLAKTGSQLDATKTDLYWMADMIFSSSNSDREYFLGKKSDTPDVIKDRYKSLKPCAHGSDAHTNDKIFEPAQHRYCWIKADPTFNGLRQVLYEPETRICISDTQPEVKPDYQVIERVEINDNLFSPKPILFNDKLNCIIGGKSTGKSLLLNNIAKVIDGKQVDEKIQLVGGKRKAVEAIKVFWADGTQSSIEDSKDEHKIVYIPQTYLNRLSDEKEELTEIDSIIKDILLNKSNISKKYKEMEEKLSLYKKELNKIIYELFEVNMSCIEVSAQIRNIGTEEGIKKELDKLKQTQKGLVEKLSLSEKDILEYDEAKKQLLELNAVITEYENDETALRSIDSVVQPIVLSKDLSEKLIDTFNNAIKDVITNADKRWIELRREILNQMDENKRKSIKEKEKLLCTVKKIEPQIENNTAIKNYADKINKEQNKLLEYQRKEKKLESLRNQRNLMISKLAKAIVEFRRIHEIFETYINNEENISLDGLEFTVVTQFRSEVFKNKIEELFDKRQLKSKKEIINIDDDITDTMITEEFTQNLILFIVENEVNLTGGREAESALRDLLSDWYNTSYQVRMDEDNIDEMSPGKKALVLLKMLINLTENECPILLDQPEDDLDNRSIFNELIPFIKKKKIKRQFIIVTHNANVVLGCDAEEVIIANQESGNAPNSEFRFEYRSGSIENDLPVGSDRTGILEQKGIQQQICDILEGGEQAFDLRKNKYRLV